MPSSEELSVVEGVRLRPAMYVGSTGFFGFINYLVCPVALLLSQRATRLDVAAAKDGFEVQADVVVPVEESPDGRVAPFEGITSLGPGHDYEGTVLNALSETLEVIVGHLDRTVRLAFRRGICDSCTTTPDRAAQQQTTLRFVPDSSIFEVTGISPAIFRSYLRRLSYLHKGVRFSLTCGGTTEIYHAESGILDLFAAVSAPYQILHEPVHIIAEEGVLQLEAVFAYQSWNDHNLWCFINRGRAVEGGTHEKGLFDALNQLHRKLKLPKSPRHNRNGVVGVMSLIYPEAVWEGCIKSRIGNPELREMVSRLVVQHTLAWAKKHLDVAAEFPRLQTFQFPEIW